jgi:hypothetical protein
MPVGAQTAGDVLAQAAMITLVDGLKRLDVMVIGYRLADRSALSEFP